MPTNVLSLSGGKDSTACLLLCLDRGVTIDDIVYVDVGWEFPQMEEHIQKLKEFTGREFTVLRPQSFDYWMFEHPVVGKDGTWRGKGYGWPSRENGRWCTREKLKVFDTYMKRYKDAVRLVGFAADELHRKESDNLQKRKGKGQVFSYPLMEFNFTEEDALQYCYSRGFDWGGLYEKFRTTERTPRLSCWCCPHQPLPALRVVYKDFPELWDKMLEMDDRVRLKTFRGSTPQGSNVCVRDLDARFQKEGIRDLLSIAV